MSEKGKVIIEKLPTGVPRLDDVLGGRSAGVFL